MNASIRIQVVFFLSYLSSLLSPEQSALLQLDATDMNAILKAFQYASTANDRKVCVQDVTNKFNVVDFIDILINLQLNESNLRAIFSNDLIPAIATLLLSEKDEEKESVCKLLWSLLHHESFKQQVISCDIPIPEVLQQLCDDTNSQCAEIARSVLHCIHDKEDKGMQTILDHPHIHVILQ